MERPIGGLGRLVAGTMAVHAVAVAPTVREEARASAPALTFRDVSEERGLFPYVAGIRGHGAAWGDVDGDGWLDLYVAAFHTDGGKPNMLFRNRAGRFELDEQPALRVSGRPTGVVFADLDNDGDLDLYLGSMPAPAGEFPRARPPLAGCTLLRNDGGGRFTNVSQGNGACPPAFGGRSVALLDYDGDGRLDLLVGEDPHPGYNGSPTRSSRLFRNLGGLQFEDATRAAGLPADVPGLGVAAGDVNGDGWPDCFLASADGGNRLFLNRRDGTFREAPGSPERFAWPGSGGDDMICGVAFGDANRDGRLDLVLGPHFEAPVREPQPLRLFLNRPAPSGEPEFVEITAAAGLAPIPMKAPHVEFQDFDLDGWPDLVTSVVRFAGGRCHPLVYRHLGLRAGTPRFHDDTAGVNDFPTPEDAAIRRSRELFAKILRDGKILYTAAAPTGDFDNDGRLDLFLPSWWLETRSLLLRNETSGGHWLKVSVVGGAGVNRMGIGARVNLYRAGAAGRPEALLGCREIAVGYGYASGQPAEAHFGLGNQTEVDVQIVLPHGKGRVLRRGVRADRRLVVTAP